MFKVISTFADLLDNNHIYNEGDLYPRVGYTPSSERCEELSTDKNKVHKPLIERIVVQEPEAVVEEAVEEPQEEVPEVVEKPARGRKKAK